MRLKGGAGATCFRPGDQGEGVDGSDDVVEGAPTPGCGCGPQGKAHEAFEATARGFDDVEFVQTTSSTVAKGAGVRLHPPPLLRRLALTPWLRLQVAARGARAALQGLAGSGWLPGAWSEQQAPHGRPSKKHL